MKENLLLIMAIVFTVVVILYIAFLYVTGDSRCNQKYGEGWTATWLYKSQVCINKQGDIKVL